MYQCWLEIASLLHKRVLVQASNFPVLHNPIHFHPRNKRNQSRLENIGAIYKLCRHKIGNFWSPPLTRRHSLWTAPKHTVRTFNDAKAKAFTNMHECRGIMHEKQHHWPSPLYVRTVSSCFLLCWTILDSVWTEQHALYTRFLHRPARKESRVPMLNLSYWSHYLIYIPCQNFMLAPTFFWRDEVSLWPYILCLTRRETRKKFLGYSTQDHWKSNVWIIHR